MTETPRCSRKRRRRYVYLHASRDWIEVVEHDHSAIARYSGLWKLATQEDAVQTARRVCDSEDNLVAIENEAGER